MTINNDPKILTTFRFRKSLINKLRKIADKKYGKNLRGNVTRLIEDTFK